MNFTDKVIRGNLPLALRKQIGEYISQFEGKYITVKVILGKIRSAQQNAYYWGYLIENIQTYMNEYGNDFTSDDVHEYCKENFLGFEVKPTRDGGQIKRIASTTKLTTTEWEQYTLRIRMHFSQFGLQLREPNEGEL